MPRRGSELSHTTPSEPEQLGRQLRVVVWQRVALLCLCLALTVVVALTYLYHHPITKLKLWKGSFSELTVVISLIAAWPYLLAMAISWAPRERGILRALGFAVVLVLSAAWVMEEIVHNAEMVQHTRDMLLFTGLQAVLIGFASGMLSSKEER
jgi:hypothetical protein